MKGDALNVKLEFNKTVHAALLKERLSAGKLRQTNILLSAKLSAKRREAVEFIHAMKFVVKQELLQSQQIILANLLAKRCSTVRNIHVTCLAMRETVRNAQLFIHNLNLVHAVQHPYVLQLSAELTLLSAVILATK